MNQAPDERTRLLIEACEKNVWLSDSNYPYNDYGYSFTNHETIEDLIPQFEHGNWSIRTGFLHENLAFVQQVNGGDEYLALAFNHNEWNAFESISFEAMLENSGIESVSDYLHTMVAEHDPLNTIKERPSLPEPDKSKSSIEQKTNEDYPISVYITNLGKYNEGELTGEWLGLPTTKEHVQEVLERIGIDGVEYEEIFFSDYESKFDDITDAMSEYMSLDEVNYLAERIEELYIDDLDSYSTLASGGFVSTLPEFINLTESLDDFSIYSDVEDVKDLGRYYVEEMGSYDLESMGTLANYIDYEALGRDIHLEDGGEFVGNDYVIFNYDSLSNDYKGTGNIPDESKVFAYPVKEKEYDIGMAHLGNGLSVWNNAVKVNGDPEKIAHINPDRTVTFYDENLPQDVKEKIQSTADTSTATISATQDDQVFNVPPKNQSRNKPNGISNRRQNNRDDR